jgi:hypothetical protein
MKLTADLTNEYIGCEKCEPDNPTPFFKELANEGRFCFRHLAEKFRAAKDSQRRAKLRQLFIAK